MVAAFRVRTVASLVRSRTIITLIYFSASDETSSRASGTRLMAEVTAAVFVVGASDAGEGAAESWNCNPATTD